MTAHGTITEDKTGATATIGFSECIKTLLLQMICANIYQAKIAFGHRRKWIEIWTFLHRLIEKTQGTLDRPCYKICLFHIDSQNMQSQNITHLQDIDIRYIFFHWQAFWVCIPPLSICNVWELALNWDIACRKRRFLTMYRYGSVLNANFIPL